MAFEGVGSVGNIATAKVRAAEGLSTGGACLLQVKGKKDCSPGAASCSRGPVMSLQGEGRGVNMPASLSSCPQTSGWSLPSAGWLVQTNPRGQEGRNG